jgi:hypothetical protein
MCKCVFTLLLCCVACDSQQRGDAEEKGKMRLVKESHLALVEICKTLTHAQRVES